MTADEFTKEHERDFFLTGKKSYEISIAMSDRHETFHNDLEDADYKAAPGDIVLMGMVGEKWCSELDHVLASYRLPNGATLTESYLRANRGHFIRVRTDSGRKNCFACRVPPKISFRIETCWSTMTVNRPGVDHGKGDFLVCEASAKGRPDFSRLWSVNGRVFENTYAMP